MKARAAVLQEGDRVLVKRLAFDGKHKLADKWEDEAYVVLEQPNKDIPVYVVQRENGTGPKRKLHRNHLLPVSFLPVPTGTDPKQQKRPKRQPRRLRDTARVVDVQPDEMKASDMDTSDTETSDSDGSVRSAPVWQPEPPAVHAQNEAQMDEPEAIQQLPFADAETLGNEETNDQQEDGISSSDDGPQVSGDETSEASHQGEEPADDIHLDGQPDENRETTSEDGSGGESTGEQHSEREDADKDTDESSVTQSGEEEAIASDGSSTEGSQHASLPRRDAAAARKRPSRPPPVPAPRRSLRKRKPPTWQTSGDHILNRCHKVQELDTNIPSKAQPDWVERASFLASLVENNTFRGKPKHVYETFCKMVMEG